MASTAKRSWSPWLTAYTVPEPAGSTAVPYAEETALE